MPNYRLYCLDGAGKIAQADWLEAHDDRHALEQASERRYPFTCEVWERDRLVGRVEAYRDAPPA